VEIVDPPADYPGYAEGYSAVFFLVRDGLKLETVHVLERAKQRARQMAARQALSDRR